MKNLFSGGDKSPSKRRTVKLNLDQLDEDEKDDLRRTVSEMSGMDFFGGRVEHGYSLKYAGKSDRCPRCEAPTRQQYANFIYDTQIAPRVLMAPAGYFCTKCRTVIIDEDSIRQGATRGFEYRGVVGLDYEDAKPPDLLKTWNGKPPILILSGDEEMLLYSSPSSANTITRSEKDKRKRKLAREARKRNRRK